MTFILWISVTPTGWSASIEGVSEISHSRGWDGSRQTGYPKTSSLQRGIKIKQSKTSLYLPGRAWPALYCNPASPRTPSRSLTCHNPRKHKIIVFETTDHIHHVHCMCVYCTSCVRYLGSYQTYVLHHVRLHHLSHQLGVVRRADEGPAAVGWSRLLDARWDLKFDGDKKKSRKSNQELEAVGKYSFK